jgi:hypothetical protein
MRLDKLGGVIALFILIILVFVGCAQVLGCIQNYGSCGL